MITNSEKKNSVHSLSMYINYVWKDSNLLWNSMSKCVALATFVQVNFNSMNIVFQDTIMAITEYSECAVTVRGTYFPPGTKTHPILNTININK